MPAANVPSVHWYNTPSATYTTGDQLQSQGNTSYSYDANGRLASKLTTVEGEEQQLTTYVYSSLGQLLQVDTPEQSIEYRHNALGQRVAKLVNGQVTEKYLWRDLTTLLATYDANGNVKQRFELTLGHTPTSFTQNGERYFIQSDHLGSPRVITDSSGSVVKTIDYDSYGNIIQDSNPNFEIPFGFAGGLHDKDTGLIRFGFRDYDPETGRWTARDPIGFAGGDTNLYGYVLGDPVNWVDPIGLVRWTGHGKVESIGKYGAGYAWGEITLTSECIKELGMRATIKLIVESVQLGLGTPSIDEFNLVVDDHREYSENTIKDLTGEFTYKDAGWNLFGYDWSIGSSASPGDYLTVEKESTGGFSVGVSGSLWGSSSLKEENYNLTWEKCECDG